MLKYCPECIPRIPHEGSLLSYGLPVSAICALLSHRQGPLLGPLVICACGRGAAFPDLRFLTVELALWGEGWWWHRPDSSVYKGRGQSGLPFPVGFPSCTGSLRRMGASVS